MGLRPAGREGGQKLALEVQVAVPVVIIDKRRAQMWQATLRFLIEKEHTADHGFSVRACTERAD